MKSVLPPEKAQAFRWEIEQQLRLLREEARELYCADACVDGATPRPEPRCRPASGVNVLHLPCADIRACVEALRRISTGCYGVCVCCGEHVELSRLTADPLSLYCIRCHSAGGRRLRRAG